MMFSTEFLLRSLDLNWADVLWGYRHQLIGWRVPIAIADSGIAEQPTDILLIELARIDKDQDWRVGEIVEALALLDPVQEEVSKRRWLYLTLLRLYENRDSVENLYEKLNAVHADFDYPEEIRSFMPYLPPDDGYDPTIHTAEENGNRLIRHWEAYLESARQSL